MLDVAGWRGRIAGRGDSQPEENGMAMFDTVLRLALGRLAKHSDQESLSNHPD